MEIQTGWFINRKYVINHEFVYLALFYLQYFFLSKSTNKLQGEIQIASLLLLESLLGSENFLLNNCAI